MFYGRIERIMRLMLSEYRAFTVQDG